MTDQTIKPPVFGWKTWQILTWLGAGAGLAVLVTVLCIWLGSHPRRVGGIIDDPTITINHSRERRQARFRCIEFPVGETVDSNVSPPSEFGISLLAKQQ